MIKLSHLEQGLANSMKDQVVNVLGFAGHMASVAATQLYHCEANTQSQRTSMAVFQLSFMMDVEIQIAYNFSVSQNIIFSLILTFKDIKTFFIFLFWGLYKNRWQARFCPRL